MSGSPATTHTWSSPPQRATSSAPGGEQAWQSRIDSAVIPTEHRAGRESGSGVVRQEELRHTGLTVAKLSLIYERRGNAWELGWETFYETVLYSL